MENTNCACTKPSDTIQDTGILLNNCLTQAYPPPKIYVFVMYLKTNLKFKTICLENKTKLQHLFHSWEAADLFHSWEAAGFMLLTISAGKK